MRGTMRNVVLVIMMLAGLAGSMGFAGAAAQSSCRGNEPDSPGLLSNLLTFWFFATPIVYPYFLESVGRFRWLFNFNPFFHLATSYQEILYFPGPVGHARWLLALGAASAGLFVVAYWIFDRLRDSFAEAV